MLSLSLGPIALPVAPLLLIGATWGAGALARLLVRRRAAARAGDRGEAETAGDAEAAADGIWQAVLVALLGARMGHVLAQADLFMASPLAVLDIRDGGWHLGAGVAAGLLGLTWKAWRRPRLGAAWATAAATGLAVWLGGLWALGLGPGDHGPPLPPVPVLAWQADGAGPGPPAAQPRPLPQWLSPGRPAIVNLWASWCGPCRQEMPLLSEAQQREAGIDFLFVNQGESAGAVAAYLTDQDLALRGVLLDAAAATGPAIGSRGLPTTLFIDAQGRTVATHFGVLTATALQARLRLLRPPAR